MFMARELSLPAEELSSAEAATPPTTKPPSALAGAS